MVYVLNDNHKIIFTINVVNTVQAVSDFIKIFLISQHVIISGTPDIVWNIPDVGLIAYFHNVDLYAIENVKEDDSGVIFEVNQKLWLAVNEFSVPKVLISAAKQFCEEYL